MNIKAIISSINLTDQTAELILPELDNAVTAPLPFYNRTVTAEERPGLIGTFVVLMVFGQDYNDGVIFLRG